MCGGVLDDGRPTLWDWNCMGSGSSDSAKMVDVCGDACLGLERGVITADKDADDGLSLTWWSYGEKFLLAEEYLDLPGELVATQVPDLSPDGND